MGIIHNFVSCDQVLLVKAEHPFNVRFIILINRKRHFLGKISIGSDIPKVIFLTVFGVLVCPDQVHQCFHTDAFAMPAGILHTLQRTDPFSNIFLHQFCAHCLPPEIIHAKALLNSPQNLSARAGVYSSES